MKKLNKLNFLLAAVISLFLNTTVTEKSSTSFKINPYTLDALKIERLETMNLLEEDIKNFNFLKKLEEDKNFSNFKDSITEEGKKNLLHLIEKYEKIKLPQKKYVSKGIYREFIDSNEELSEAKSKVNNYQIVSIDGLLYLKNLDSYKQEDNLKFILKDLKKLGKLEEFSLHAPNIFEKSMALTILNSSEYVPFIKQVSDTAGVEFGSSMAILSNESSGYPYIVGRTGDLNSFQINPSNSKGIYKLMKKDKNLFFRDYIKKMSLEEFENEIKNNPKTNIVAGIYLLKIHKEESKNESESILLYHLGRPTYGKIPWHLRKKIELGKIRNSQDIHKKDERYLGMEYLKYYYDKKEAFYNVKKIIKGDFH